MKSLKKQRRIQVIIITFIGCATSGSGSSASSAGGSGSKLSDADFKRMGINKSSYGNSN